MIFVYDDDIAGAMSVFLRGKQMAELLDAELIAVSEVVPKDDETYILVKPLSLAKYLPIKRPNNKVFIDVIDAHREMEEQKAVLKHFDGAIYCSKYAAQAHSHWYNSVHTIYHSFDPRLYGTIKKDTGFSVAYFGGKEKFYEPEKIPVVANPVTRPDMFSPSDMAVPSAQYIIKPDEHIFTYDPLTKLSTASYFHSPVMCLKNAEIELLGEDYPFYTTHDQDEMEEVYLCMKHAYNRRSTAWGMAVRAMTNAAEKTNPYVVSNKYLSL